MAVTQSRTQVNDKASGAEPMQSVPTSVVPGQAREDIGGPTIYDYDSRNDSAKIENKGTSQSTTEVNDKAGAAADTGGGTGGSGGASAVVSSWCVCRRRRAAGTTWRAPRRASRPA